MTTIFLADAHTLRVSFQWSQAAVDAIKTVGGARWHPESRTWRVPLERLDALLTVFGDSAALAPEVVIAAAAYNVTLDELPEPRKPLTPEQRIVNFAKTCAEAGVTLRIEGPRVVGSGGAWTPVLQGAIDARAVPLRRLLASGWQPPRPLAPPPAAPVPASYDHITHLDRVMAAGEANWLAREVQKQEIIDNAKRRKRKEMFRKFDAQLGIEGLLP